MGRHRNTQIIFWVSEDEKEMMEEKLYQRMQEENQQFLAELREQTADDIIAHAYEIACRDNFLMLFKD